MESLGVVRVTPQNHKVITQIKQHMLQADMMEGANMVDSRISEVIMINHLSKIRSLITSRNSITIRHLNRMITHGRNLKNLWSNFTVKINLILVSHHLGTTKTHSNKIIIRISKIDLGIQPIWVIKNMHKIKTSIVTKICSKVSNTDNRDLQQVQELSLV